ncbi:hypothetical protein ACFCQI_02940 [Rhodanobacter sp. FW102-FHT14D06]|uniref:Uncharacterized protein n=2 Tax=unclassified Rhodanobacter TaxID=2621553 RepID=A0AB74UW33_9GAMM
MITNHTDIIQAGKEVGLRLEPHDGGYRMGYAANTEGFWIDWIPAERIESVIERFRRGIEEERERVTAPVIRARYWQEREREITKIMIQ